MRSRIPLVAYTLVLLTILLVAGGRQTFLIVRQASSPAGVVEKPVVSLHAGKPEQATPFLQRPTTPSASGQSHSQPVSRASAINQAGTVEELVNRSAVIADVYVDAIWLSADSEVEAGEKYTPYLASVTIERSIKNPDNLRHLVTDVGAHTELLNRASPLFSDNLYLTQGRRYRLFLVKSAYRPFVAKSLGYFRPATGQGTQEIRGSTLLPLSKDSVTVEISSLSAERLTELSNPHP